MLNAIHALYARIPEEYLRLMEPQMQRLQDSLEPGLTVLNWTSVEIPDFISNVYREIHSIQLLLDRYLTI